MPAPKRIGRPRAKRGEKKTEAVLVKLTPDERARLEQMADGLPLATYIRRSALLFGRPAAETPEHTLRHAPPDPPR